MLKVNILLTRFASIYCSKPTPQATKTMSTWFHHPRFVIPTIGQFEKPRKPSSETEATSNNQAKSWWTFFNQQPSIRFNHINHNLRAYHHSPHWCWTLAQLYHVVGPLNPQQVQQKSPMLGVATRTPPHHPALSHWASMPRHFLAHEFWTHRGWMFKLICIYIYIYGCKRENQYPFEFGDSLAVFGTWLDSFWGNHS